MVQSINKSAAECLVFFNPLSSDSRFWKSTIPKRLLNRFEVVFYEYPGYNSPFIKLNSFNELALYVNDQVLNKIEKPVHLIGYSYGGLLVQHLLNLKPHNVKSAILVACANKILPRDKEILSVLKKLSEIDMYLFCRVLTLLSHGYADINRNPLLGLQKFSNLRLTIPDSMPVLQQINHILHTSTITIQQQATSILLLYGSEDRMIDTDTLNSFNEHLENLCCKKLHGEAHMMNPVKMFYHINQFLKKQQYESNKVTAGYI
ncbi:MAG TPA: alpha/beta fold hydrolase [Chitinophaga sp.]|uniref:alpha/beta fold hydrolase n=1 Tax=Chitinophaga sp. TaxID=1869181 RepID=UPI002DBBF4EE|nr:alpha/beta fold hydrolase [Chitinophaga sp.]HEU4552198.1 alpha/beta fold hydrolase [Chitinophaga sp.]